MARVTVSISRSGVYAIAEGISVTISQHNGGTPSYEQLWASPSESPKLDIYYREAVGDLERHLMEWAAAVSAQFRLTSDGADYTLTLNMSRWWPARLEGLLANKIQDYLVHAVTAGWLNDFDGLTVKQDYRVMATQDIADIREIIHQRNFDFTESEKAADGDAKDAADYDAARSRATDTGKDAADYDAARSRATDTGKDRFVLPREAGFRKKDDILKKGTGDKPWPCLDRTDRHTDNDTVNPRTDWTDWSGTGIAYRGRSCRPVRRPDIGMGYTPQPEHRPCDPEPRHGGIPSPTPPRHHHHGHTAPPPPEPKVYPDPPYHAKPFTHPQDPPMPALASDGSDWCDSEFYDTEREGRFIESHDCGHRECRDDAFGLAEGDEEWEEDNENQ